MSGISTHVLDTARGRPAAGVAVSLARKSGNGWTELAAASTDAGGRVGNLLPQVKDPAGTYRLRFDVGAYFAAQGGGGGGRGRGRVAPSGVGLGPGGGVPRHQ